MGRSRLAEELSAARQELAEANARCKVLELDAEALRDAVAGLHRRLLAEAGPVRRRLEAERQSTTVKITIIDLDLYVTVGVYDDGSPGEIFVATNGVWDRSMRAMLHQWAIAVSIALQWGADGRGLFEKFSRQRFEPSGLATPQLGIASSPVDAISRWVLRKFYPEEEHAADQR